MKTKAQKSIRATDFNRGYLCSFLLQTATLILVYVVMATVNKLVYQPVVTENHRSHSLKECKTVGVSDIANILNKAGDHHTTILT